MSGPKVVRIVTRDELMARSSKAIEAARKCFQEWRRSAARFRVDSPDISKELEESIHKLEAFHAREQWAAVQTHASALTRRIKEDIERMREDALSVAARGRATRRRVAQAAQTVMAALRNAGKPVGNDLVQAAEGACGASDQELARFQTVLSQAMRILASGGNEAVESARIAELAGRLADGTSLQTISQWLSGREGYFVETDREERLDRLVAELDSMEDSTGAEPFRRRLEAIDAEQDRSQRELLIDSVSIDLATYCKRRREGDAELQLMKDACANLGELRSERAIVLHKALLTATGSRDLPTARPLYQSAVELLEDEARSCFAKAQRAAILKGLTKLGYEIRETMATALSQGAAVVVQKPGEDEYGVELSGPPDAARLQLRLVGFAEGKSALDAARAKDMETIWCGEVAELRTHLEEMGNSFIIEKALAPGQSPLKVLSRSSAGNEWRSKEQPAVRANRIKMPGK